MPRIRKMNQRESSVVRGVTRVDELAKLDEEQIVEKVRGLWEFYREHLFGDFTEGILGPNPRTSLEATRVLIARQRFADDRCGSCLQKVFELESIVGLLSGTIAGFQEGKSSGSRDSGEENVSHDQAVKKVLSETELISDREPDWQTAGVILHGFSRASHAGLQRGGFVFVASSVEQGLWSKRVYEAYLRFRGWGDVCVWFAPRQTLDELRKRAGIDDVVDKIFLRHPELVPFGRGRTIHPALQLLNSCILVLAGFNEPLRGSLAAGRVPSRASVEWLRQNFDCEGFERMLCDTLLNRGIEIVDEEDSAMGRKA